MRILKAHVINLGVLFMGGCAGSFFYGYLIFFRVRILQLFLLSIMAVCIKRVVGVWCSVRTRFAKLLPPFFFWLPFGGLSGKRNLPKIGSPRQVTRGLIFQFLINKSIGETMDKLIKIDYLAFSVALYKKEKYLEFLGAECIWLDKGFRGYKEAGMLSKGGMFAMSIGRPDCHFDLPGKAFSSYVESFDRSKLLFDMIKADKGNISRVDISLDIKNYISFDKVLREVKAGKMVSKSKKVRIVQGFENVKDGLVGNGGTIYVGSGKSDRMVRIYDKGAEQGVEGDWVRFEMQLRNESAMLSLDEVMVSPAVFVEKSLGLLLSMVDFRKRDNENISRRSRLKWYEKLMSGIDKVKLIFEKNLMTVERVVEWVEKQVAPSLALMVEHYGECFSGLLDYVIIKGKERLREKHFIMLGRTV